MFFGLVVLDMETYEALDIVESILITPKYNGFNNQLIMTYVENIRSRY